MFALDNFIMLFSNKLITWYLHHKRELPWRETQNPYAIWLSEIILQQTRVAQGLPYFTAFLQQYPTVCDLAAAPEDEILKLWQGLGYYSRARNLHATAKRVTAEYQGQFPNTFKELLQLKGVGDYTAAAIASIAFGEVVPVVDGNVFRVLSRYYGITSDISSGRTKKEFQALAQTLIPQDNPASFNQAIMDFGALQCVPKSPNCGGCIFAVDCVAFQTNQVAVLPVKLTKNQVRSRYLNYVIYSDPAQSTLIQQRTAKDIWQKLYEFPLIETPDAVAEPEMQGLIRNLKIDIPVDHVQLLHPEAIIHKLSHRKLHIRFWEAQTSQPLPEGIPMNLAKKQAFPIVIHNFIEQHYE